MKWSIIIIGFFWIIGTEGVSAQHTESKLGEVTASLSKLSDKPEKVDRLVEIARLWRTINSDSSAYYASAGVALAQKINYQKGLKESLFYLAALHLAKQEYEIAYQEFSKGLEIARADQDKVSEMILLNASGLAKMNLKEYEQAIQYHETALKIAREVKDSSQLSNSLAFLSRVCRLNDQDSLALSYQFSALEIRKSLNVRDLIVESLMEIGLVYEKMGNLDKALDYFIQVLETEEKVGNKKNIASALNNLSGLYQKKGDAKKSISTAERALAISKAIGNNESAFQACSNLASCYWMLKDYKNALKFQDLSETFRDSLIDKEKKQLRTALSMNYTLEKKNLENRILKEKEIFAQQQIKRQSLIIVLAILALIFAISFSIVFFRFNQTKKRNNQILQKQKEALQIQKDELSKAFEQLKVTQEKLVQSEKMASLGQLTAGIAHEINNPVNFIYSGISALKKNLNFLALIIKKYDSINSSEEFSSRIAEIQKLREELKFREVEKDIEDLMLGIEEGAARTTEIIKQLQHFSKKESVSLTRGNVHKSLDSTLLLLKNQIAEDIEIIKNYDPKIKEIECYEGQLGQVFMNIINNSLDALNGKSGIITITTKDLDQNVCISIADNGPGMNTELKSKIFDPFFTTKDVGKGMGLGMFISYGIIKRHRGKIEIESIEGKGTRFDITLPKRQNID